jgi:hypothetical protein
MARCFECRAPTVYQYHVVPRRLGGTKTVPLCEACHRKVLDSQRRIRPLTRKTMQWLKAQGKGYTWPAMTDPAAIARMPQWRAEGWASRVMADAMTVRRVQAAVRTMRRAHTARGGCWTSATERRRLHPKGTPVVPRARRASRGEAPRRAGRTASWRKLPACIAAYLWDGAQEQRCDRRS